MKAPRKLLRNCLLGGAAGDCIGGPHEAEPARGPIVPPAGPWRTSDDTAMSLATARAILGTGRVDPGAVAQALLEEFRSGRITGIGASTLKAMRDLEAGAHWALAGRAGEFAAGNGAAMRVAPLAFFVDARREDARRTIRDVCRITHHSDEAYVGALAVVRAIQIPRPQSRLEHLMAVVDALPDTNVRDALEALAGMEPDASVRDAAAIIGTSGHVSESVPLAVFAAVTGDSLEDAILDVVACGGDTDTTASIAGQIMGAWGSPLPHGWHAKIPSASTIDALCAAAPQDG